MITMRPSTGEWPETVRWQNKVLLLSMGDKTKELLSSYSFFFFWGGIFIIYNIHFVFHNICNISQQQTTQSYATGESEQSKTLTYYVHLFVV